MSSEIMTREEQKIAVAEACGWERYEQIVNGFSGRPRAESGWLNPHGTFQRASLNVPPNFNEDANAQFEAWRGLSEDEKHKFSHIWGGVALREEIDDLDAFNRHFCEIFLKTKNLWK